MEVQLKKIFCSLMSTFFIVCTAVFADQNTGPFPSVERVFLEDIKNLCKLGSRDKETCKEGGEARALKWKDETSPKYFALFFHGIYPTIVDGKKIQPGLFREDVDGIPSLLEKSEVGKKTIFAFPQGGDKSVFLSPLMTLKGLSREILDKGQLPMDNMSRVFYIAHSAGGNTLIDGLLLQQEPRSMPSTVVLLDGVNSDQYLVKLQGFLTERLEQAVNYLDGAQDREKDSEDFLPFRFFAYFTNASQYDRYCSKLRSFLEKWFRENGGKLGGKEDPRYQKILESYQVVSMPGSHSYLPQEFFKNQFEQVVSERVD